MQECPDCHAQIDDQAFFCDQCGFQLKPRPLRSSSAPSAQDPLQNSAQPIQAETPPRSCPVCGYFNLPGDAYCTNCGAQLIASQAPVDPGKPAAAVPLQACPSCGAENPIGEAYCLICGFGLAGLLQSSPELVIAPLPIAVEQVEPAKTTPAAPEQSSFETNAVFPRPGRLYSPGTNASLPLPAQAEIILGRRDPERGIYPDVDLSSTGLASETVGSSVSRQHARLLIQGNQVFVEDLNSTNSTFLNRQRLQPGQRYLLNPGDELRLGGVLLIFYTS